MNALTRAGDLNADLAKAPGDLRVDLANAAALENSASEKGPLLSYKHAQVGGRVPKHVDAANAFRQSSFDS